MGGLSVDEIVLAIAAGRHLLRAGREVEALPLLRHGAVELTMRGEGLTDAAPALEEAVEVYRARSPRSFVYGGMMTALALAGTYADWRLSFRYGAETLEGLSDVAGTSLARRLAPVMGARAALYGSLALGFVLFTLLPSRRVTHSFRQVLLGLIGLGTGTVSVCTVLQDGARARTLLSLLSPLRAFPRLHPAHQIYEYQCALVEHASGLYAEARTRSSGVLAYLRSASAQRALPPTARAQLEAGVLILLGMLDACRTDGLALETLAEIERQQTSTSRQTYTATRMAYHGHRGERKACIEWREQTDRLAARGGATWRNDVQVPRMLWSTHAMCGDLLTLKRDMEQLQGLAAEVPTLSRLRDLLHACYLCERGMPEEALARYERTLRAALEEPGLRALQQLGAYARILRKAGRAADAVAVCESALQRVTDEEAHYTVLLFALHIELPLALCALGEHARARTSLDALLAAQQLHDNPMLHGLAHGARAEVALAEQDWPLFDVQIEEMRRWLRTTQHPTLFAQSQRLLERARAARSPATSAEPPVTPARAASEAELDPDFETA